MVKDLALWLEIGLEGTVIDHPWDFLEIMIVKI